MLFCSVLSTRRVEISFWCCQPPLSLPSLFILQLAFDFFVFPRLTFESFLCTGIKSLWISIFNRSLWLSHISATRRVQRDVLIPLLSLRPSVFLRFAAAVVVTWPMTQYSDVYHRRATFELKLFCVWKISWWVAIFWFTGFIKNLSTKNKCQTKDAAEMHWDFFGKKMSAVIKTVETMILDENTFPIEDLIAPLSCTVKVNSCIRLDKNGSERLPFKKNQPPPRVEELTLKIGIQNKTETVCFIVNYVSMYK